MSRGKRVLLTTTMIKNMSEGKELWDSGEVGLHVRALAKGATFRFQYTSPVQGVGKKRKTFGVISLDQARKKARKWREKIEEGVDPANWEMPEALPATLKDLEARWEVEAKRSEDAWAEIQKNGGVYEVNESGKTRQAFSFMKPATIVGYRKHFRDIFIEFLEEKPLVSFTMAELDAFHRKISIKVPGEKKGSLRGGAPLARMTLRFLRTLLKAAVRWGLLESAEMLRLSVMFDNIETQRPRRKKRFIQEHEMPRFFEALERLRSPLNKNGREKGPRILREDRLRADLVEILLATGSRVSEFMGARLSWIDWRGEVKAMVLPDSKRGMRRCALGDRAALLLKARAEEWHRNGQKKEDDWCFPSPRKKGAPLTNHKKGWKTFVKDAGLEGVTAHTIRHTILTMSVQKGGQSIENAANIGGHASTATTQGYIHEVETTTVEAINKTMEVIDAMRFRKVFDQNEILPDYIKKERAEAKLLNEAPVTSAH